MRDKPAQLAASSKSFQCHSCSTACQELFALMKAVSSRQLTLDDRVLAHKRPFPPLRAWSSRTRTKIEFLKVIHVVESAALIT